MTPAPGMEPRYTLKQATEMIPTISVRALQDWLYRHRDDFPARTMPWGRGKYPRFLTLTEIQRIRGMRTRERQPVKRNRPPL